MDVPPPISELPVSERAGQKKHTRDRIIAAALALIREGGEGAVTMRPVAAAANVTERTVFRHFESRDVLLAIIWRLMRMQIGTAGERPTPSAWVKLPRSLFRRLEQQRDLVRAYLYSNGRRTARNLHREERREQMVRCVQITHEYLAEHKLRRRAAIADLITSPYAWEWMHEYWGFSSEEAGEASAEALEILINLGLAY